MREGILAPATWLLESCARTIDAPEILPGPDGSIDLHWDCPAYELLINIPVDPSAPAGFYGDDRGAISIKGKVAQSGFNQGLHLWLAKTA